MYTASFNAYPTYAPSTFPSKPRFSAQGTGENTVQTLKSNIAIPLARTSARDRNTQSAAYIEIGRQVQELDNRGQVLSALWSGADLLQVMSLFAQLDQEKDECEIAFLREILGGRVAMRLANFS